MGYRWGRGWGGSRWAAGLLVGIAGGLAVAPLPPDRVEQLYARGLYPAIQRHVTPFVAALPGPLLDLVALALVFGGAVWAVRRFVSRRPVVGRSGRWAARAWRVLVGAALLYLWFLIAWGLNYRRAPLAQWVDYDERRVTPAAIRALAEQAALHLNQLHPVAHRVGWPAGDLLVQRLQPGFERALAALGLLPPAPPVPKVTRFGWYFRRAGIDGLTDPFFLEVLLNPDLLPVERPFVVAHEWAHLAGVAREAEASWLGWFACQMSEAPSRYSAWLALAPHVWQALGASERRDVLSRLDPGPRSDLAAVAARAARTSPHFQRAAWRVYDRFLKLNRVAEGVASYDEVVRLVLAIRTAAPGSRAPAP